MSTVQIYGSFSGYDSFAIVARNLANVLQRRRFNVQVFGLRSLYPRYTDMHAPVGLETSAPTGIFVGYPEGSVGALTGHTVRILFTVCESSTIPDSWVDACNKATLVCVPSRFCHDVFTQCGVRTKIMIVPHGIDLALIPPTPNNDVHFKNKTFLHVTAAMSFPQRKGTSQLILAFRELTKRHKNLRLLIKTPDKKRMEKSLDTLQLNSSELQIIDDEMFTLFPLYHVVDAVIQPSRGEGFGMVPVEARCAGTHVILTNSTGHKDHFVCGLDTSIETAQQTVMATQGNATGMCPTISVAAIVNAVEQFLADKFATRRGQLWAAEHAHKWAWKYVLASFVKTLRGLQPQETTAPGQFLRGIG